MKIPIFEQQRLASEAVGTPGLDVSMANALSSVSSDLTSLGKSLTAEHNARLKIQQQIEAKKQEMLDDVEIAKQKYELESDLRALQNTSKEYPTEEAAKFYGENSQKAVNARLESIQNPNVKNKMQVFAYSKLDEYNGTFNTLQETRKVQDAKGALASTEDRFILDAKNFSTPEDMLTQVQSFMDTTKLAYANVFGTEAPVKQREATQKAVKEFLSRKLVEDPNSITPLLQEGVLDPYLMEKDKVRFLKDVAILQKREQAEQYGGVLADTQINFSTESSQILSDFISGALGSEDALTQLTELQAKYTAGIKPSDQVAIVKAVNNIKVQITRGQVANDNKADNAEVTDANKQFKTAKQDLKKSTNDLAFETYSLAMSMFGPNLDGKKIDQSKLNARNLFAVQRSIATLKAQGYFNGKNGASNYTKINNLITSGFGYINTQDKSKKGILYATHQANSDFTKTVGQWGYSATSKKQMVNELNSNYNKFLTDFKRTGKPFNSSTHAELLRLSYLKFANDRNKKKK